MADLSTVNTDLIIAFKCYKADIYSNRFIAGDRVWWFSVHSPQKFVRWMVACGEFQQLFGHSFVFEGDTVSRSIYFR